MKDGGRGFSFRPHPSKCGFERDHRCPYSFIGNHIFCWASFLFKVEARSAKGEEQQRNFCHQFPLFCFLFAAVLSWPRP